MAKPKLAQPTFKPLGDGAVRVAFGDAIDPGLNRAVRAYAACLERETPGGVIEWVPSYAAVTVFYKPHVVRYGPLCEQLKALVKGLDKQAPSRATLYTLPVRYSAAFGADLGYVAERAGVDAREVIERHCAATYLVYMLGFAPGFAYLGGLDPRLATPRLDRPRDRVAAGSVGIAGDQCCIYPIETPGGWRVIGRTPVRVYDPARTPAVLLKAGDRVRFRPVDEQKFLEIEQRCIQGSYTLEAEPFEDA
ncbi:MAG: 5-oxoprolinase subunit PxpB [Planctomycetota bacterium]|nr:5-oxoprolinase subunit PxpB [Planctomycetota bacterium]